MINMSIKVSDVVAPLYVPVLKKMLQHEWTHYILKGGRGSTKSSFLGGIAIPLLIIANPNVHAVCFRKIANTVQRSTFAQVVWGIYALGLESLFEIPKSYSTPIKYKPTGQTIMFMGLDDPQKVKSIKVPFGYVGITWWEEFDQYSGPKEIRTALQSTMRGGDKFWNLMSFNPPISMNNWANEYAEDQKTREDTLVIHNTYLDVPREWLGEAFITEAEVLKALNYKAYQHEYLGEAVGTGGGVFPNACNLDMRQEVPYSYDMLGNVVSTRPMWQTWEKDFIFNGLDWGFALDPTHFVKCYYDKKHHDVYVFKEYRTNHSRNEEVFRALYEGGYITREEMLTCDSAEQKSIADFKTWGAYVRGAKKGPGSRERGVKWLQSLNHIYIDKEECPYTYKEFMNWEYEQNSDGEFISKLKDGDDHSIDSLRYSLELYYNKRGN